MHDKSKRIEAFTKALEKHIFPVAKVAGLTVQKIQSELYWLIAPTFILKFECGLGHAFSYGVVMYPKPAPLWYADHQYGIIWLAKFQGWELPDQSVFCSYEEFDLQMANLSKKLPDYIKFLEKADYPFWEKLHTFVQKETDPNFKFRNA